MSNWFNNRGQMVQVACAVVGAFVALMAWLAIPPAQLLYVAPVVFIFCVIWLVGMVAYRKGRSSALPSAAAVTKAVNTFKEGLAADPPQMHIVQLTCKVGALWEGKIHKTDFRISAHAIERKDDDEPRVDIEVIQGVGPLTGGSLTRRISAARFWMPRAPSGFDTEPKSVYSVAIYPPMEVKFFYMRVLHINTYANEIQMEMLSVTGQPTINNTVLAMG